MEQGECHCEGAWRETSLVKAFQLHSEGGVSWANQFATVTWGSVLGTYRCCCVAAISRECGGHGACGACKECRTLCPGCGSHHCPFELD